MREETPNRDVTGVVARARDAGGEGVPPSSLATPTEEGATVSGGRGGRERGGRNGDR